MSNEKAHIDMDPSSDHDPDAYAAAEAEHRHAVAVERVREYLVTRDGFYGREAGDEDVLDTALVGTGYEGSVPLRLSDLRVLVGAPGPETYDDRLDAYWPEPEYVDCTCGHPNDDHVADVCPFVGCGCGAGLDETELSTPPDRGA